MMMMTVAVLFSGNNSFISFGKKTKEKKFTIKSQTDDDEEKMFFHLSLFLRLFVCCYLCHSQYSNGHKFHPWIKKMLFCRLSNEFSQHRMEKTNRFELAKTNEDFTTNLHLFFFARTNIFHTWTVVIDKNHYSHVCTLGAPCLIYFKVWKKI